MNNHTLNRPPTLPKAQRFIEIFHKDTFGKDIEDSQRLLPMNLPLRDSVLFVTI